MAAVASSILRVASSPPSAAAAPIPYGGNVALRVQKGLGWPPGTLVQVRHHITPPIASDRSSSSTPKG